MTTNIRIFFRADENRARRATRTRKGECSGLCIMPPPPPCKTTMHDYLGRELPGQHCLRGSDCESHVGGGLQLVVLHQFGGAELLWPTAVRSSPTKHRRIFSRRESQSATRSFICVLVPIMGGFVRLSSRVLSVFANYIAQCEALTFKKPDGALLPGRSSGRRASDLDEPTVVVHRRPVVVPTGRWTTYKRGQFLRRRAHLWLWAGPGGSPVRAAGPCPAAGQCRRRDVPALDATRSVSRRGGQMHHPAFRNILGSSKKLSENRNVKEVTASGRGR